MSVAGVAPEIVVRDAVPSDARALAELAERTFRATYAEFNTLENMDRHCTRVFGEAQQTAEIHSPDYVTLVADEGGKLGAYAQLKRGSAPACVAASAPREVWRFYVDAAWQGSGLAYRLMDATRQRAAELGSDVLWLGVWQRNARAVAFYERCGLRIVGEQIFTLGDDPQPDYVMARELRTSS